MKALEDSLNRQLLNIDMNLGLNDTNKEIQNQTTSLETQNQAILSIIYDEGKSYESHSTSTNPNNFVSQLENFGINQMTLQVILFVIFLLKNE